MSTMANTKVINMAAPTAVANIIESMENFYPVRIPNQILLTESDSNEMIDKLAAAIKFKAPDGDADNSFEEGSDDDEIKLDENGNYVGKGKMTIFNKDVNLKEPSKTTEQWMETPTGKVSDAETEQVPVDQKGVKNINESVDLTPVGEGPSEEELKAHGMKASDLKAPNIEDHRNMKSPLNQPHQNAKVNGAIKNLFANVPTKGGLHESFLPITEAVHADDPRYSKYNPNNDRNNLAQEKNILRNIINSKIEHTKKLNNNLENGYIKKGMSDNQKPFVNFAKKINDKDLELVKNMRTHLKSNPGIALTKEDNRVKEYGFLKGKPLSNGIPYK